MKAAEVCEALTKRWPESEYLHIAEAPLDSSRQGRKLDLLVISLWRSRGHERDGVEVKVSWSDYKREIKDPAKADQWWGHVHRFWIAAPLSLAKRILDEEPPPSTWGLLGVTEDGSQELVKPKKHDPAPFAWPVQIGLMRASADAGVNALMRAEQKGYDRGYQKSKAEVSGGADLERVKADLERLRAEVSAFEEHSGVNLADRNEWMAGERWGRVVVLARSLLDDDWHLRRVAGTPDLLRSLADKVESAVDEYTNEIEVQRRVVADG